MWVATRNFRYRGTSYKVGDKVPAEGWPNRRALSVQRRIKKVDSISESPPETPESVDYTKLKRTDLNTYASSIGIENAEGYPNRDALLEAVELKKNPPPAAIEKDEAEDNPFADLEDEDEAKT